MNKRNEEWLKELVSLLHYENETMLAISCAGSDSMKRLLKNRYEDIQAKKTAYEQYEISAVYEIMEKIINEPKLLNILKDGKKYALEKRKIVIRIARGKAKEKDTFNDFLIALILMIVSKNFVFNTLISSLLFAEKMQALTYDDEEIITKYIMKGGNYD